MLLLSTSGPFGKYIDLPVTLTIEIRALIALIFILIYCRWKGISLAIRKKDIPHILLSGLLMGLHWTSYFKALQLSNVAIGMLSLFTYPVLTALLEPMFLKTTFQKVHLLLALLVLAGIYFLVPEIDLSNSHTLAICFGVFSALCYALRNLIMKTKVAAYQGSVLMGYQLAIVGLLLFPTYFLYDLTAVSGQWEGLIGVALITTAMGHTMFINTFKHFSITTISIISSIIPVYGIIIGAFFLSEIPTWPTVFGGTLILGAVIVESIRSYK